MRYINIIKYVIIQLSSPKRIRHQKSWKKLSTSWIVWCTLTLRYFTSHVNCWCRAWVSSPFPNSFSSSFVKNWTLGIFFPESIICNFFFWKPFQNFDSFQFLEKKSWRGNLLCFQSFLRRGSMASIDHLHVPYCWYDVWRQLEML